MSTKDKIIEALASLIKNDQDVKTVSISKIAELAHIGKSTVYEHFTSKKALIKETYQFLINHYCDKIVAPFKENTFEHTYKEITRRIFYYSQEANELMMSILSEGQSIKMIAEEDFTCVMKDAQDKIQETYINILKKGVQEGIIHENPKQSKEKGHIVKALTVGLMMQRINKHVDLSEEDAVDYLYKYTITVLNA